MYGCRDFVKMALAADKQRSALAHVASYKCHFNMFVGWCGAVTEPRMLQTASDIAVAL